MSAADTQAIDLLEALIGKLPADDREFATGLVANTRQCGATERRMDWIATLIKRAQNPTPAPAPASVGSFAKVYALFATAQAALKFPKIRLQMDDGAPLVLAIAGAQSKAPGVLNVTDGQPFGMNKWYGRVTRDGAWTKATKPYPETEAVEAMLKRLGEDPADTASEYGRLTGHCCFCDRPLKDEQSTAAGYGPTCAKNFGLTQARKNATPVFQAFAEGAAA